MCRFNVQKMCNFSKTHPYNFFMKIPIDNEMYHTILGHYRLFFSCTHDRANGKALFITLVLSIIFLLFSAMPIVCLVDANSRNHIAQSLAQSGSRYTDKLHTSLACVCSMYSFSKTHSYNLL